MSAAREPRRRAPWRVPHGGLPPAFMPAGSGLCAWSRDWGAGTLCAAWAWLPRGAARGHARLASRPGRRRAGGAGDPPGRRAQETPPGRSKN